MSAAYVVSGLRVRIKTLVGATAPRPLPADSGFTEGAGYPLLGVIEHGPDGELWFIVPNDQNMIYRISNRHCRYESKLTERPLNIDPQLWEEMQHHE